MVQKQKSHGLNPDKALNVVETFNNKKCRNFLELHKPTGALCSVLDLAQKINIKYLFFEGFLSVLNQIVHRS
jgi:hypothetical protein